MALDTVERILDFAIKSEEQAAKFYTALAHRAGNEHMKEAFLGFAEEEDGHKAKLLKIKKGEQMLPSERLIVDLKIADSLEPVSLSADLDYRQALIVAMKAEKAAFKLYTDLASVIDEPGLKAILLGLAREEAKHKLRFELEYDTYVLKEM